jgi:hypothetical protein
MSAAEVVMWAVEQRTFKSSTAAEVSNAVMQELHFNRMTVVTLPEAEPLDDGYIAQFYAPANGNHVRLRWSKDIVVDGNWYDADQARDVAAALLAAANAAEASA